MKRKKMSDRLIKKSPFTIAHAAMEYPTPINLSYLWSFGSLSGIILIIQIATGIVLAMHYTPHVDYAFLSVEHIMRDVNYGWLIRYIHANGASMFFLIVYLHMARGLYYGSYGEPRGPIWNIGVIIFLALMAVGFLGYVLPWGQMSFWGATVITNFFSAIPIIGESIVYWLWGGFSVDNATLNRFFSLHYFIPFVIAALSLIHIFILHDPKSGNPLGLDSSSDRVPFHPYFTIKDIVSLVIFLIFFSYFIFFNPNILGHSDNYILANPMVTPPHIVPEWYYLPFYAILRAVPHKLGGIIAMIGAILILLILPFTNTSRIRSSAFRPIHRKFYWIFIADVLLLLWIGGNPAEQPYTNMGLVCSIYYFTYLIILIPIIGSIENILLMAGFDENDDVSLSDKNDLIKTNMTHFKIKIAPCTTLI